MFLVNIAGHLGKDPETRFTPSGQKVTSFTVAVNQRKGKEDVTVWVRAVIWGDRFDKMLTYLKKGSAVIVSGRMNPPSTYTDKEGRTQISLEITAEMIDFSPFGKNDRGAEGSNQSSYSQNQGVGQNYNEDKFSSQNTSQYGQGQQFTHNANEDDDLPF